MIAAPVGPIGVLCIRRTLAEGRISGLVTGLGAAAADGCYGGVAAFGITAVSDFLVGNTLWLQLAGGAALIAIGVRTFRVPPASAGGAGEPVALPVAFGSTFLLTLTNPTTILSFAAIFAGVGLGSAAGDYAAATILVIGVFLGSALWWLGLSFGVASFRRRLGPAAMGWINRLSGAFIGAFGVIALVTGAYGLV